MTALLALFQPIGAPVVPFLAAAALCLVLPAMLRGLVAILAFGAAGALVWLGGAPVRATFGDLSLVPFVTDDLSFAFAIGFCAAGTLAAIYAFDLRSRVQQIAMLLYAGAAVGAVHAGDLITLFVYWEVTALASAFIVWGRGTEGAFHTGMRYLVWQIGSGLLLVAGLALHYRAGGAIVIAEWNGPASTLSGIAILTALGIKGAFPLAHSWLKDAYPAALPAGTVVLSIFTTKMAIYALARLFPGTELLVLIGCIMAVFPVFFALAEDDLRRALAYMLVSQLGLMVIGVGIGTPAVLSGTAAHAMAGMVYFALLFMATGAVLRATGTARASLLGGLHRAMPATFVLLGVAGLTAAALPLTAGYVSKTALLASIDGAGQSAAYLCALFASAGTVLIALLRIPAAFLGETGPRASQACEAPVSMLLAMALAALVCIIGGVWTDGWLAILPAGAELGIYKAGKVVHQLELVVTAALAFVAALRMGWFGRARPYLVLDADWFYRTLAPAVLGFAARVTSVTWEEARRGARYVIGRAGDVLRETYRPGGRFGTIAGTGTMVLWLAVLLCAALVVNLLDIR